MGTDRKITAGGEPDPPKPVTARDIMVNAYSSPEFQKRLSPYFTQEMIDRGVSNLGKIPSIAFENNTDEKGFFDPKTNELKYNTAYKGELPNIWAHEGTHGFDAGARTLHEQGNLKKTLNYKDKILSGINELQNKVNSYVDPSLLKNLKEGIKKGDYKENSDSYLTDEGEVRARLNELRMERLIKNKKSFDTNWEDLKSIKSPALEELRLIMKDEDIIKALNEIAGNNYNKIFSNLT